MDSPGQQSVFFINDRQNSAAIHPGHEPRGDNFQQEIIAFLAEKLGVAQSSVGNWENGIRKPDVFMLKRIAEVLGCTTDDLLSEPEPATPAPDKAE